MKKIFIIIAICCFSLRCSGSRSFEYSSFLVFINYVGVQQGVSSLKYRPAIDFNTTYGLFFNGGVNYQFSYGWNVYAGLGIISFLDVQYGYALGANKHLARIRTDIPLDMWFANWFEGRYSHPLAAVMLGFYIEHAFKYSQKGTTIGITISYPFAIDPDKTRAKIIPGWNM